MAIFGDLLDFGELSKPLAAIDLPKSLTFFGNFCKGVKIYHFPSEIILGQLLYPFSNFFLVTLVVIYDHRCFKILAGGEPSVLSFTDHRVMLFMTCVVQMNHFKLFFQITNNSTWRDSEQKIEEVEEPEQIIPSRLLLF